MAPRFNKTMFYTWGEGNITLGLVGFSRSERITIFQFRDQLVHLISRTKNLLVHKQEGEPTKHDSAVRLFERSDYDRWMELYRKKVPTFLDSLLKTTYYKEWSKEWGAIAQSAKVTVETSHDHPCILVDSSVHPSNELAATIREGAEFLSLKIYANPALRPMGQVIMSNRTYDIDMKTVPGFSEGQSV